MKEYKLSIGKDTATVKNFRRPTTLNSNPIQDKKTFEILEGLPRLLTTDQYDKISQSGDDIKEAAVKTNKEKYEKTKQGLNAAGILAQAGLAFAGSTAGAFIGKQTPDRQADSRPPIENIMRRSPYVKRCLM